MKINEYVKKWCDEAYDIHKEDFYIQEAYYISRKQWATSGIKHGILAAFIALCSFAFTTGGTNTALLNAFVNLGILTVCYFFYAVNNFDCNDIGQGTVVYVMAAIFLFTGRGKVPEWFQILFAIAGAALWFKLTIWDPINFAKLAKETKKREKEEQAEEEAKAKAHYADWEAEYKAYRQGLPEPEVKAAGDPMMRQAQDLFKGYTSDKQTLKTRYRQLAKQYHPDKGGDTKLFQCIITVYEQYKASLT